MFSWSDILYILASRFPKNCDVFKVRYDISSCQHSVTKCCHNCASMSVLLSEKKSSDYPDKKTGTFKLPCILT